MKKINKMKITTTYLKQVIKEELNKALQENTQEDEDVKGQWGDDSEDLVIFPDGSDRVQIQADTGNIYIPKENLDSLISILQEINEKLEEEKPLEEAAVGACKICGNTYEECEKDKVCPEGPSYKNSQADKRLKKRKAEERKAAAELRGKQNQHNKPPPPEERPIF